MTQARHLSYSLISQLYLEGVTAVTLPLIQAIPELASTLPAEFDMDQTAVTHQTIFGFNVFPYESFFLDSTGLIGGDVTEAVVRKYRAAGFQEEIGATSPDHIGHELAYIAHLLNEGRPDSHYHLRVFFAQHLLIWLPSFVLAVSKQGSAFYTALSELTWSLVADHADEIGSLDTMKIQLPNVPDLLQNDKTSLKDISEFLTMPVYCGIYLGREEVAQLARRLELPRGFGSRSQMLTNLLKTAVQYDQLPLVITKIQDLLADERKRYIGLANDYPQIAFYATRWEERTGETAVLLSQMEHQIQQLS